MITLPTLDAIINLKDYYQIIINIFQEYINKLFGDQFL